MHILMAYVRLNTISMFAWTVNWIIGSLAHKTTHVCRCSQSWCTWSLSELKQVLKPSFIQPCIPLSNVSVR